MLYNNHTMPYEAHQPTHPGRKFAGGSQDRYRVPEADGLLAGYPSGMAAQMLNAPFAPFFALGGPWHAERANANATLDKHQLIFDTTGGGTGNTVLYGADGLVFTPSNAANNRIVAASTLQFDASNQVAGTYGSIARTQFRLGMFARIKLSHLDSKFALGIGNAAGIAASAGFHAAAPTNSIIIRNDTSGSPEVWNGVTDDNTTEVTQQIGTYTGITNSMLIGFNVVFGAAGADQVRGNWFFNDPYTPIPFSAGQLSALESLGSALTTLKAGITVESPDTNSRGATVQSAVAWSDYRTW